MSPGEVSRKPNLIRGTDFNFLFGDGVFQGRLNEVERVAIAERMIVAYFAIILNDEDIVQVDRLRNRRKLGVCASGDDLDVLASERWNKRLQQVSIGTAHILNVVQSEFGHKPILEGVK